MVVDLSDLWEQIDTHWDTFLLYNLSSTCWLSLWAYAAATCELWPFNCLYLCLWRFFLSTSSWQRSKRDVQRKHLSSTSLSGVLDWSENRYLSYTWSFQTSVKSEQAARGGNSSRARSPGFKDRPHTGIWPKARWYRLITNMEAVC